MKFNHSDRKPASDKQRNLLLKMGINVPTRLSSLDAHQLIQANSDQWKKLPATEAQEAYLRSIGKWQEGMKRGPANELLSRHVEAKTPCFQNANTRRLRKPNEGESYPGSPLA